MQETALAEEPVEETGKPKKSAAVVRTYKYEVRLTPAQAELAAQYLGWACDLYNALLQQRRDAFRGGEAEVGRRRPWHPLDGQERPSPIRLWDTETQKYAPIPPPKGISTMDQSKLLTQFRQESPDSWPAGMPALVQHEVRQRVERAFQAFFRRVKEKSGKAGAPRFRSKDRYDSLTFGLSHGTTAGAGTLRNGVLRLAGLGEVKLIEHRPMPEDGVAKSAILLRSCGRWYVSISIETPPVEHPPCDRPPAGLDVGAVQWVTVYTKDAQAARALQKDLRRMALDERDRVRLWAAERHAARLSRVLAYYNSIGMRRLFRCKSKRYRRVLARLELLERQIRKIRARLELVQDRAAYVVDPDGAAVLIEGSGASERAAKRVARTQRRIAKRTRRGQAYSKRRKKAVQAYARARERERRGRGDHRHKVSRSLVRHFGFIYVEQLDVKKLTRAPKNEREAQERKGEQPELPAAIKRRLNRQILDGAVASFFTTTGYKAVDAGGAVVKVPAEYTTIACSKCGTHVPKPYSLRVHRCPQCGFTAPRTVNSARNVLQRGLEQPGRAGPSVANGGAVARAVG